MFNSLSLIAELKQAIQEASNIVVFTGAGVSTLSDIPDYRSPNGIYKVDGGTINPESVLSVFSIEDTPEEFFNFYVNNMYYPDAKPNVIHKFIANIEHKLNKKVTVITQNIDGLHQKAGSSHVIELHGTSNCNHCINCGKKYEKLPLKPGSVIPRCTECNGLVRPDIALYGEVLNNVKFNNAVKAANECELFVIIGTSMEVYPANTVPCSVPHNNIYIINDTDDYDKNYKEALGDNYKFIVEKAEKVISEMGDFNVDSGYSW